MHTNDQKSAGNDQPIPPKIPADLAPEADFKQMGLSKIMLRALVEVGYEKPSPIQSALIPPALDGYDVIGQARTGTGKTASFAIPILEQLDPLSESPNPQALILVPTRELATQVHGEILKLAFGCPTEAVVLCGGKLMDRQLKSLRRGVQIVVGTPGRVLDHIQRGTLKLGNIWCVVLDEADRMLDIGFRPDIERILRRCPEERQTLLLSATLAPEILQLADKYLFEPIRIDCSSKNMSVETIEQRYFTVDREQKVNTLVKLLRRENPPQAIIFCRTKIGTAKLHRRLEKEFANDPILGKMRLETIHGNMTQPQRDRVFENLRSNSIQLLVATDVVGRGIDVSTISHIINFDIPQDCDDYVHRVGRTGRMGRDGIAFTFVCKGEGHILTEIEQRINRELIRDSLDGVPAKAISRSHDVDPSPTADPSLARKPRSVPKRASAWDFDAVDSVNVDSGNLDSNADSFGSELESSVTSTGSFGSPGHSAALDSTALDSAALVSGEFAGPSTNHGAKKLFRLRRPINARLSRLTSKRD